MRTAALVVLAVSLAISLIVIPSVVCVILWRWWRAGCLSEGGADQ